MSHIAILELKPSTVVSLDQEEVAAGYPGATVAEFRDPDRYTPDETSPTDPDLPLLVKMPSSRPDETSARVPDLPLLVKVPSSRRDETTHMLSTISLTEISRKWLPAWVNVE